MTDTEAAGDAPAKAGGFANRRTLVRVGVILAALVVGVSAIVAGRQWWLVGRYAVSTDDAYVGVRSVVLSPKVSGYVAEILIADNAPVKTGDLIARIDSGDYRLALRTAEAQLETQRAAVVRMARQVDAQRALVAQARAQVDSAKAAAVRTSLDLKRQRELAARNVNTAQTLDTAEANDLQAKAAVAATTAAVTNAEATVNTLTAQQGEAEAGVRLAEVAVAKAERDLTFTEIRAPIDGVLGNRAIQIGDYVQPAQRLAALVPLQDVFVDANFKETQLSRIEVGQPVRIQVDAHASERIEGRVLSLAPASGAVFSLLPPDNATGNFTKVVQRLTVRIALPPEAIARANLKPGMSVYVSVDTRPADKRVVSQPQRATSSIR